MYILGWQIHLHIRQNHQFERSKQNSKNSKEEEEKKKQEIESLEKSIQRRKTLLSNENYCNKAPKNIVDKEREDLQKEMDRLEILKKN